jgi:cytochrome c2
MQAKCIAAIFAALLIAGCATAPEERVTRGAAAIAKYGCGSCHTLKGIRGANGLVGPPLNGIGSRMYVAGMLQNTPENLARWIYHPKSINPKTAMPDVGASEQDASDIAAYLKSK